MDLLRKVSILYNFLHDQPDFPHFRSVSVVCVCVCSAHEIVCIYVVMKWGWSAVSHRNVQRTCGMQTGKERETAFSAHRSMQSERK